MSNTLVYSGVSKKTLAIIAITVGVLFVALIGIRYAAAVAPSDYGLHEGDTVSAAGSDDPDVYIVNDWGYKRLFLNPVIFGMYGHLGGFANVKSITPTTRDAFGTSGLFRNCETNDQKVYGVETTGEDTGVLHWVNTTGAQAVADDPAFFKKVFCINTTEFNWYAKGADYTSVSQVPSYARVPGQTPGVPGALSVSLASGNPVATTVTTNAQGVEFLKFQLSGTGTINTITVKRAGAGSVNDFDNVYLYEGAKRLVDGKSLSSSTGEATFNMGSFAVSGTRILTVVGDLSATAGNVDSFQVTAVTLTSGTVSGLPVAGNNLSISGATSGTLTQTKTGSIANPNAGAVNVEMSEFKLAANTEAASIKRMQMIQGGSVKPADLTNMKLKTGTNEWAGTMDSAGRVVFDMGSGFTIAKGGSAIFKVYGDVAGKKAETIALYFESVTDILAVGDQYGFGVAVTLDTAMDDATNPPLLTLQGGILTATFAGPTSANIGTATDDTDFLDFNLAAASNIEIKKTRLNILFDLNGTTWDDLGTASLSSGIADLDDIKIVNRDTGSVLCGPVDGSSFTTDEANGAGTDKSAAQYAFTDAFDMTAGQTLHLKVTADLKTANTRTGTDIEVASRVAIGLASYADDLGVTEKKYTGTTTALAASDIVPNANINGPAMTVVSSALTLSLAANPADSTAVKGTQGIDVVGITFAAANASDLLVTDITLTGYSSSGTGFTGAVWSKGSAGDIGSMVGSVYLVEKESGAIIAADASANNLAASAGTLVYNNLSWKIPAGQTKTLLVKANLLNLTAPTKHYFAFDIVETTDVTATDNSGNTVNAAAGVPNASTTPTITVDVIDGGHIFVTEDDSSPSKYKNSVYWGQTGVTTTQFKLRSTNEAFLVDKMTIDATGDSTDAKNNVKNVYLEYKNKAGTTITTLAQPLDSNASTSFSFSGDNRPYVPQDSYTVVSVKIDTIATYAAGATSGVDFGMDFDGTVASYFEATGEGSMDKIYGADASGDSTVDVDSTNKVYVYRSFPRITEVSLPAGATSSQVTVGKFDITAMGYDVTFTTTAASGSLVFDTVSSGSIGTSSPSFTLYDDATNTVLDTALLDANIKNASVSFNSFSNTFSVPANTTKRIRVQGDLSRFQTGYSSTTGLGADYFQLILQDQADVIKWQDGAGALTTQAVSNKAGYLRTLPAFGASLKGQ